MGTINLLRMIKRKPSRETLIYVGLWTAFFLIPVVSFYFVLR